LPFGGILRGRHEVNGELEHFSHPDMPNGTWGVYCPTPGCGARPSKSRSAILHAIRNHCYFLACGTCNFLRPRVPVGGSLYREFLSCSV
jgi:hypothetical protein